jgi:hypothetical protein
MSRSVRSNRLSKPPDRGSTGHSSAREIVEFGMAEEQLYSPQILCPSVNQCGLRPP